MAKTAIQPSEATKIDPQRSSGSYESNPIKVIWASISALGVNLGPLFGLIFLPLGVFLGLSIALGVLFLIGTFLHSAVVAIVAFVLGAAALIFMIYTMLLVVVSQRLLELSDAKQERTTVKALIRSSRSKAGTMLGALILAGVISVLGTLLLVIPGIILGLRYALVPYIVASEDVSILGALARSWRLTKGHTLEMFGVVGINLIVGLLFYVPILGLLLYPLAILIGLAQGVALAYRYLGYLAVEQGAPAPKLHPFNLLVAITAALLVVAGLVWGALTGWSIYNDVQHPVSYKTDCYSLKLPKSMKVELDGHGCKLTGRRGREVDLEIYPVSGAFGSDQAFYDAARHDVYSKEGIISSDSATSFNQALKLATSGKPAITVSAEKVVIDGAHTLRDGFKLGNQEQGSLYFLYYDFGYQLNGKINNGFVIVQRTKSSYLQDLIVSPIDHWQWDRTDEGKQKLFRQAIDAAGQALDGQKYNEVISHATEARSNAISDEERGVAAYWLSVGYDYSGQTALAEQQARLAVSLAPNFSSAHVALGSQLLNQGNVSEAAKEADIAVALDPSYSWAYNLRGLVRYKKGDRAGAIADIQKAIDLTPKDPIFQTNLALVRG